MACRLFAYLVVIVHGTFVLFVALGGLLVLWKRRWAWLHVPALFWGAWIEFSGGICPLTPLENWLSAQAGRTVYRGDFIDHILVPLLYPADLTREFQIILGVSVILINAGLYAFLWRRIRHEGNPG